MIDVSRVRWPAVLVLAAALALAGCSAGAAASTVPSPTAVAPTASIGSTPPATGSPPSATPSVVASEEPGDSLEPPPVATLVTGGSRNPGEPGSWVWAQGSSDSPWLPAQALERADVRAGPVSVELPGDVAVESWSAVAATAADTQGLDLEPLGNGTGEPSFGVSAGAWVVAVDVRFADGLGSATYYWHLAVT